MPKKGYKKKHNLKGEGFFDDVGDFVKSGYNKVKSAHNFLKDNKLISKGLALGTLIAPSYTKIVPGAVGSLAGILGYGRKKKRVSRKK